MRSSAFFAGRMSMNEDATSVVVIALSQHGEL